MDMDTLIEKLNEISWIEYVNFEISEKYPQSREDFEAEEQRLQKRFSDLGSQLTPEQLESLETDEKGIEFALRLSIYVEDDDSLSRAKKHLNHESYQVRFWAKLVIEQSQ